MWTAASRGVDEAEPGEADQGAFPRLAHRVLDFARRLVEVNVHREVELLGEVPDPLERLVAHRVRRVRCEGGRDQPVAAERLVHLEAAGEVRIQVPGPRGRHLEDDEAEHGPDPDVPSDFPHDIREEVHVIETGSPSHQHLGRREACPGPDERLVHEPCLGRPHVLREPGVQGQVVGEAPEQGHRGVGVGVDEPRDQRMAVEVHALAGREPRVHLVRGTEGGDGTVAHRERVFFEDAPGRLDRDDPRSAQYEIRRLAVSHGEDSSPQTMPRRGTMPGRHAPAGPSTPDPQGLSRVAGAGAGSFCSGLHRAAE